MTERPWVLVTADGPQLRDPLVSVRGLAEGGYRPAIALSRASSLAQVSRACERVERVPPPEHPSYATAIEDLIRTKGYVTVITASEKALLALGAPEHLVDKDRLNEVSERVGIPVPTTTIVDAAALGDIADELTYPTILKPTIHTTNALRCNRPEDVRAAVFEGPVMVQPFLTDPGAAVCGVMWKGRMVAAVHEAWDRTWPVDVGVASSATSVAPDVDLEKRLTSLMDGYDGLFNAQFIGPYLIDLNLRPSTTHPLGVAAGVNLLAVWCDLLRGIDVADVRGRPGVGFRWIEGDTRSVAKLVRTGRMSAKDAARALRPRAGTAHATESLRDPRPFVRRVGYLIRRTMGSES